MNENTQMGVSLQEYFQNRYKETISVVQEYAEFSGDKGKHYRVVCKSESYDEPFVVMLYPDPEAKNGVVVKNDLCAVEDKYPDLFFQNEIAKTISKVLDDPVLVRCRVDTFRTFTKDEVDLGLEACMQLEGANPFVRYYVLLRPGTDIDAQAAALKRAISEMPIPKQYLFLGTAVITLQEEWTNWYLENYDNFDYYITHTDTAADVVKLTIEQQ